MNTKTAQRIVELQETLLVDRQYRALMEEYHLHNSRFVKVLEELSGEQRGAVEDYLGVCVEMHLRMLESACTKN